MLKWHTPGFIPRFHDKSPYSFHTFSMPKPYSRLEASILDLEPEFSHQCWSWNFPCSSNNPHYWHSVKSGNNRGNSNISYWWPIQPLWLLSSVPGHNGLLLTWPNNFQCAVNNDCNSPHFLCFYTLDTCSLWPHQEPFVSDISQYRWCHHIQNVHVWNK